MRLKNQKAENKVWWFAKKNSTAANTSSPETPMTAISSPETPSQTIVTLSPPSPIKFNMSEAKEEEKEELELSQATTWRVWRKDIQEAIMGVKN